MTISIVVSPNPWIRKNKASSFRSLAFCCSENCHSFVLTKEVGSFPSWYVLQQIMHCFLLSNYGDKECLVKELWDRSFSFSEDCLLFNASFHFLSASSYDDLSRLIFLHLECHFGSLSCKNISVCIIADSLSETVSCQAHIALLSEGSEAGVALYSFPLPFCQMVQDVKSVCMQIFNHRMQL